MYTEFLKGGADLSVHKKKTSKAIFETSVLIYYLTKFSGFVYRTFLASFFGWLMTSYESFSEGFTSSVFVRKIKSISNHGIFHLARRTKRYTALTYERSFFLNQLRSMSTRLLTAKLNTFGLFFFSYGFYLIIIQLIKKYSDYSGEPLLRELIVGSICVVSGFSMLFSKKSLASAIYESEFLRRFLFDFLGIPIIGLAEAAQSEIKGSFNMPFIFGMLFGFLSIFVEPLLIFFAIVLFALLFVLILSPESGVILTFFALPFMSTIQLSVWICLIFLSYILKLICGRRLFRFHMIDFAAFGFLLFLVSGGIVTVDGSSFVKMLVMVCFMGMYFVIKNIISSPAMVKRCLLALTCSSMVVSIYGIYQNYFGALSTKWQDTEVFFEIKGRVVSVFENPNVLGEFLVLILPITLALMATAKRPYERFFLFASALAGCWCLVFTWSRGAWIGCIIATVLFLCVSSRYFFTAGLLSLPWIGAFICLQNDSLILTRLTTFGDSSTSYRVGIWRGVLRMLKDVGFCGIGIGEGAFEKIYPMYALSGIETAPHAHNLYLQIAVEMGVLALVMFLAFVFLFAQFSFSFCKTAMSRSNKLLCLGIFCGVLALLVQGMTDYVWYNYRVFLLFWMVVGLGVAHVYAAKNTEEEMDNIYF
jgi:O-antigen ligase